jgi:hypothetical protein
MAEEENLAVPSEKYVYIIMNGNFVFQSFNQKLVPFSSMS